LVGKPTSHLEGTGIDQKILKWFFNRAPGVEYIHLMLGPMACSGVHGKDAADSIICRKLFVQLNNH